MVYSFREEAHYLPWCTDQITPGHWAFVNETQKSFQCCSWDKDFSLGNDPAVCGNERISKIYQQCFVGSNAIVQHAGSNACSCDDVQGRSTVYAREKYDWIPSFCRLQDWNAPFFCELLGNRTIMLVGDSSMEQSASTLMAMIKSGEGGCADQIKACRSDYLYFGIKEGELSLKPYFHLFQPDIVVLTFGAHAQDDGDVWTVWSFLEPIIAEIRNDFPDTQFVWRSQNPGHVNCHAYSQPSDHYDSVEEQNSGHDRYRWHTLPHIDEYNKNKSIELNITFLDLSPLYLRPDSHTPAECLHYCMPGPLNIFSRMMLQLLYNKKR